MRALYIHADSMEFEAKEKTKVAEEIPDNLHNGRMEEVLVAFITVESSDEDALQDVAAEASKDILATKEKVGAERIMLYPYAHLSKDLAKPKASIQLLDMIEKMVAADGTEVVRAPFGWYKSFDVKCKGHPLSELSRDFTGKAAKKSAPKGKDVYFVLTPEGEEVRIEDYRSTSDCMRYMIDKEALGKEAPAVKEPDYLRLCKKFGIQWESMSDAGHMCLAPHGAMMFDLISDYATQIVNNSGFSVYNVKGTNMFSLDEPAVKEHADLFGDRLYTVDTGKKKFVLRYAACHQQFAMIRNWNISYRNMPFGAFEVADSYRMEQSGETMLCFRTRRLNMPDFHVMCRTVPEAQDSFRFLDGKIYDEIEAIGREYEMLVNFSSMQAYRDNKDLILKLCNDHGRDALIHIYPEGINYYWTVNIEYHMLDQMKRPREIGTVQIDIGNAQRFGITYSDENGEKQYPVILHCAVIGSIERWMYTLLDTAVALEKTGVPGYLPVWIAPEQVRLMAKNEECVAETLKVAEAVRSAGIRVSVDDTDATVGKKVRLSKQDWCSYAAVIGEMEIESGQLKVYVRSENRDVDMTVDELVSRIKAETEGMPVRGMYMPSELSKRCGF
ncbi:MAG: threonine--tRNA ligase [Candidatus Methanomethylophilaceae archaeon]|jgi:threonyl-tRNA synthetase|nr:threonine--tRNA ligase [Candidatus Methanomethylophilaceae archaeon]MDD2935847.1 threonine--tRNA ligase [Candidatus Methanomethylophilaceae archaeon]MDD3351951.1 threonine--tRNA ligase [Candidatus Methanomethylophilaceae archaeon]MDD3987050.1 threonine--tRNA ligase [Candidatus Methanomethylophilaceae archaeon]MDD4708605.1 threonine--tRNA ligase [Candidatus Methanomethylophilaceae archaeon]